MKINKDIAPANIAIQPAFPIDAKKIWKIYKAGRIAALECAELGVTGGNVWSSILGGGSVGESIAVWEKRTANPSDEQQVLMAVEEPTGSIVGMVWPNVVGDTRYLSALNVVAGARNKGIGSMLLQTGLAWHQFEEVTLKVASHSPAVNLYERHGFEVVEEIPDGIKVGDKHLPQKIMVNPGHAARLSHASHPHELTF